MLNSIPTMLLHGARSQGGVTLDPYTGESPLTGYAVGGMMPGLEIPNDTPRAEIYKSVSRWCRGVAQSGYLVGSWLHNGILYFDAVKNTLDHDYTRMIAKENNEIAVYCFDTDTVINVSDL